MMKLKYCKHSEKEKVFIKIQKYTLHYKLHFKRSEVRRFYNNKVCLNTNPLDCRSVG